MYVYVYIFNIFNLNNMYIFNVIIFNNIFDFKFYCEITLEKQVLLNFEHVTFFNPVYHYPYSKHLFMHQK